MANIIQLDDFRLNDEAVEKLSALTNEYDDIELELVSGSDITACPFCRANGCYGACSIGR